MLRKSNADGPKLVAPANAPRGASRDRSVDAPDSLISSFALERRAGWQVPRRSSRLINLERRARFARIETV